MALIGIRRIRTIKAIRIEGSPKVIVHLLLTTKHIEVTQMLRKIMNISIQI